MAVTTYMMVDVIFERKVSPCQHKLSQGYQKDCGGKRIWWPSRHEIYFRVAGSLELGMLV